MKKRLITSALAGFMVFVGVLPVKAAAVSSASAVVYEPENGLVLFDKAGEVPRPMASTTKLMTALLTVERLTGGQAITVPSAALPVEGSQMGLQVGDQLTVDSLLTGLLLASGNDAANVLALQMADSLPSFAEEMNARAATLGMKNSLFVSPSGLDGGGHSASALDMARLGAAVLRQPLLAEICRSKTRPITLNGRQIILRNHNKLLWKYEPCIGLKNGFTRKAGRCLVSAAQQDGVTLIAVTLNGSDYWNDHIALYKEGFAQVERVSPSVAVPELIPVAGGTSDSVGLVCSIPEGFTVHRGETVTGYIELPRFLWAPLADGQTVGKVTLQAGDRTLGTYPILTVGPVAERPLPTPKERVRRHLIQLWQALVGG